MDMRKLVILSAVISVTGLYDMANIYNFLCMLQAFHLEGYWPKCWQLDYGNYLRFRLLS